MMHISSLGIPAPIIAPPLPVPGCLSAPVLSVRPLTTHTQRRAAHQLVRRMYAWRGYLTDGMADMHDNPYHLALAAWGEHDVIATLAVGRDSHQGLLAESLYADEVSKLRAAGKTLCEYIRFAVDPEYRSPQLLSALFRAAYQHAKTAFGATDALIEVNPRHTRFYHRELGFRRIGDLRLCPRVAAPAVLMHRDLTLPFGPLA